MCFTQYGNYQKFITLVEGKLSVALQKPNYTLKEGTGTPMTSYSSSGAPSANERRCLAPFQ